MRHSADCNQPVIFNQALTVSSFATANIFLEAYLKTFCQKKHQILTYISKVVKNKIGPIEISPYNSSHTGNSKPKFFKLDKNMATYRFWNQTVSNMPITSYLRGDEESTDFHRFLITFWFSVSRPILVTIDAKTGIMGTRDRNTHPDSPALREPKKPSKHRVKV